MDDTQKGRRYNDSADIAENHAVSDDDKMNSRGAQQESDVDGTIVVDFRCPKVEISHPNIDEEQPGEEKLPIEESATQQVEVEEPAGISPRPRSADNAPGIEGGVCDDTIGRSREELQQQLLAMANQNRLLRQQAEETRNEKQLISKRAEETTKDNQLLMQQAENTSNENRMLRQQVEETKGASLKAQIIIAIMSALFGWNAPIIFDMDEIIDGNYGLAVGLHGNHSLSCPRTSFHIFLATIDFSDALLDLIVSVRAVLQDDDSSDDNDTSLRGWAMLLFSMTIAARLLAGVFGVVYYKIDKADRLFSYYLVEMMIFFMEDMAAVIYILKKYSKKDVDLCDWDRFDAANALMTVIYAMVFVVPSWCHRRKDRILLVLHVWMIILIVNVFCIAPLIHFCHWNGAEIIWNITYPICFVVQLYILCRWSQYLYRKKTLKLQPQELEGEEEPSWLSSARYNNLMSAYDVAR